MFQNINEYLLIISLLSPNSIYNFCVTMSHVPCPCFLVLSLCPQAIIQGTKFVHDKRKWNT